MRVLVCLFVSVAAAASAAMPAYAGKDAGKATTHATGHSSARPAQVVKSAPSEDRRAADAAARPIEAPRAVKHDTAKNSINNVR